MSAVVKGCIARGYTFAAEGGTKPSSTAKVKIRSELISFHIEEPSRRIDHVLTKQEERAKAAGRGWAIEKYDFVATGKLRLVIDEGMQGEQKVFADTETRRLEDRLQEFMVGLRRAAMVLTARTNYWNEWERAREEVAQRQRDEEARLAAESRRRRELLRDAANFSRAEALNRVIAAVERRAAPARQPDAAVEEWLSYARSVAESLNPVPRIVRSMLSSG